MKTGITLLVLLSPGISLQVWKNVGTLERELKPYLYHIERGGRVIFLQTRYNTPPVLPAGMEVVRIPDWRLLPLFNPILGGVGKFVDVVKSSNSAHVHVFLPLLKKWKKPFLLRCGYVAGKNLELRFGRTKQVLFYQERERAAFASASLIQVTTAESSDWLIARYRLPSEKIKVVPNFVEVDHFAPQMVAAKPSIPRLVSVGRLAEEKQYHLLIDAAALLQPREVEVHLVGQGSLASDLIERAQRAGVRLTLHGKIDNAELPHFFAQGDIFVLPSAWEGHPKALIEAMSCALPCVGTKVPGIQNLLENGKTGLLTEGTPQSIADALASLYASPELAKTLGDNARQYAIDHFSLPNILRQEAQNIETLAARGAFNQGVGF